MQLVVSSLLSPQSSSPSQVQDTGTHFSFAQRNWCVEQAPPKIQTFIFNHIIGPSAQLFDSNLSFNNTHVLF